LDVNRMLTNKPFRAAVVEKITDPVVRSFWTEEFATYTDRYTQEATPAIQNKVGQFVSNPLVRNIVGQPTSSFNLREMMDTKKIFIVNLSKGRMGESNAALLGSMLTVKIYLAAMSRADESAIRMDRLPRCYFYVDEFQSMMNEAFADILSESRKYKLGLTLANQYIEQMEEEVRDAVFGNVGTLVTFRVGPFDAEVLETVYEPVFTPEDLVNLGIGQIYLTLMIDGVGSPPFSAETIPPIEAPHISYRDDVVRRSRESFGRTRAEVEKVVSKRQQDFAPPAKVQKPERDRRDGPPMRRDTPPPMQRSPEPPPQHFARNEPSRERPVASLPPPPPPPQQPQSPQAQPQPPLNQQSALRDAILSARHISTSNDSRSPAEILRSRVEKKVKRDDPKPSDREPVETADGISTDALRKILNG
ncbi:MAG: type IV secretory system conjugative DNA transfer family protein, partial [Minisyncoccia bacterium]